MNNNGTKINSWLFFFTTNELGHGTDWKNTYIVASKQVYFKGRKFSEALVIKKQSKNCNRDRRVFIPDIYNCIAWNKQIWQIISFEFVWTISVEFSFWLDMMWLSSFKKPKPEQRLISIMGFFPINDIPNYLCIFILKIPIVLNRTNNQFSDFYGIYFLSYSWFGLQFYSVWP